MATFKATNNRDKGNTYIKALVDAGHIQKDSFDVDFLLLDLERHALEEVNKFIASKKPVFIYPHAAIADILWDGMYVPLKITRNFVPGEGQKEVMRLYGYPNKVVVCGWPYGKVIDFIPTTGKKLLYAPIHPNSRGRKMRDEDKANNKKTMLLILENKHLFDEIRIRFGGRMKDNGLEEFRERTDVVFENAVYHIDHSIESISRADIVISFGTFGYLSVSQGKPTIFYGQETPPHNMRRTAKSYEKYMNYRRFPLDTDSCPKIPFKFIIEQVCTENYMVEDWKERFIGNDFDSQKFISTVEQFL